MKKGSVAALARDVVAKAVELKGLLHPEAPFPSDILVIDEVRWAYTIVNRRLTNLRLRLTPPQRLCLRSGICRFSLYLRRPLPSLIFYCAIARKSMTCPLVSKIPTTANGDRPYTRGR